MRWLVTTLPLTCACFLYTTPIEGDEDTKWFFGQCQCSFCMNPGSNGSCNGSATLQSQDVQICQVKDNPYDTIIFPKLTSQCVVVQNNLNAKMPTSSATCGLVILFPQATGTAQYINPGSQLGVCKVGDPSTGWTDPGYGAVGGSHATVSSQVIVTGPSLSATANVTGEIQFYGGNCSTGECPIQVTRVDLSSPSATVTINGSTKTATDTRTINTTVGTGTCISLAPAFNACGFLLDPSSLNIVVTAINPDTDTRQLVTAVNSDTGGGILDFDNHGVAVTQQFSSGSGVVVQFDLSGTVDNFAPHVSLPNAVSLSCGNATVTAEIEDVDDPISSLQISWLVDGVLAHTGPTPLNYSFAPGTHTLEILAVDPHGAVAHVSSTLTVAPDVTPPHFVANPAPVCLWPPDHDYNVITSSDLSVLAVDDCDPHPRIVFISGTSSQSDNGIGDGNTTNDLVVHPDDVCVRAERAGPVPDGRVYAVQMVAIDASGNVSSPVTADITVPHDQSKLARCDVSTGTPVADNDPRCQLPIATSPVTQPPGSGGGCSSTGGRAPLALFAILFAILRVPRRSRRS